MQHSVLKTQDVGSRFRRSGVAGRLNAKGEELTPFDEEAIKEVTQTLVEEHDVESIAVSFLYSYQNEAHEQRAAEIIRETNPDVSISVSSDILGELREYERTTRL